MAGYKSKGVWGKRVDVTCQNCGITKGYPPSTAKGKRFCCKACRHEADRKHPKIANCDHCKKDYRPKAGNRQTFCSRECHFAFLAARKSDKPLVFSVLKAHCRQCSDLYTKERNNVFCSAACKKERARIQADLELRKKPTNCRWCDVLFCRAFQHGSLFCSDDCKLEAKRAARRRAKNLRYAIVRGSFGGTALSASSIFDRDNWTCQACGCDTPADLRGSYDDNAPELDHIHPVSKGGLHEPSNLQCLCRLCNQMKSNKPMDIFLNEIKGIGASNLHQ